MRRSYTVATLNLSNFYKNDFWNFKASWYNFRVIVGQNKIFKKLEVVLE